MSTSQNYQPDKTRQANKIKYDEKLYYSKKEYLDKLGTSYSLKKENCKTELAYISRIILLETYGKNHMSQFLRDFENIFPSVEYVFKTFLYKNKIHIYYVVIIAIGIVNDYYTALILLEAAGYPFNNIEYSPIRKLLEDFYSQETLLNKNAEERFNTIKNELLILSSL